MNLRKLFLAALFGLVVSSPAIADEIGGGSPVVDDDPTVNGTNATMPTTEDEIGGGSVDDDEFDLWDLMLTWFE